ncbi:MAG: hypothetical protein AAF804_06530 [Bacteroidota bacterium]
MSKSYTKPLIWIVDTSIFCNILDVPGRNQDREVVLDKFKQHIKQGDLHMLPFTTILETGNHIGQLGDSGSRKKHATHFVKTVEASVQGETPWRTIAFPDHQGIIPLIDGFHNQAERGVGFGDHLIIKHWEEACQQFPAYIVKIWSLDSHLAGYECNQ